jgi:hypothetical protein
MVPKASKAFALRCQLAADRLAGCRRVDARFTLAVWTLASDTLPFGHWSRRTLVTIGNRSLSALVTLGAGRREKPLHQPVTIQRPIQCTVQTKSSVPA